MAYSRGAHPHLDTAELWWAELRAFFRRVYTDAGVGEPVAAAAAEAVRDVFLERYWTVFEDVRPSLQRLHDGGYRNAILSNHVPELDDLVYRLRISDLIDAVLTSAVTGHEKPHPAMFDAALRLMGHPRKVWMVGDNPTVDIAGASAVGIPAILVRTADSTGAAVGLEQAVDHIMDSRQL